MEGCLPDEASIRLVLHTEQGEVEAGEVVVVDAAIHKSRREAYLADVLLDGELGGP